MTVRKKSILAVLLVIVLSAATVSALYLRKVSKYQSAVESITYSGIDIADIPDGTYTGECDVDLIRAKVEVTVEEGRIVGIDLLEHHNDRGGAATGIEQNIVEQQRIDVDAVSGATNSSKVIKKAVDNALNSAPRG